MRIDNQLAKAVEDNVRSSATRATGSEAATTKASSVQSDSDHVSLSGASSLLSLAKSLPSDRSSKIAALTSQIKAGTYRPDAAATSRSIVQQHVTTQHQ